MTTTRSILAVLLAFSSALWAETGAKPELKIAEFQAKDQPAEVAKAVEAWQASLGEAAGVEAEESVFSVPPETTKLLEQAEVAKSFAKQLDKISADRWWEAGKLESPEAYPVTLRWVAGVLEGVMAAELAGCERTEVLQQERETTAKFLRQAQTSAGGKSFAFPAWKTKMGKLPQRIAKALAADKEQKLVKNGWFLGDLGSGEGMDENAACALALLHHFQHTKAAESLASAKAAADWALAQTVSVNWSNNALPVVLWSELFAETKAAKYLEAAKKFVRLGVLPGQLKSGPQEGHWVDPLNARVVPHYLLVRALAAIYRQLPAEDALRAEVEAGLLAGLVVRNAEVLAKGACQPESTGETFIYLLEHAQDFEAILPTTQTPAAAERTFLGLTSEFQQDHPTVTVAIWGKYLNYLHKNPN